jgi:FtsP/CotA-like multicopper oxidase with cupredoxin domain
MKVRPKVSGENRRRFLSTAALAAGGLGARAVLPGVLDALPYQKASESKTPEPKAPEQRAPEPKGPKADVTLRIAPVSFEIAPGRTIRTYGYNGQVPGPVLRMKEGAPVVVDVVNETDHEETVHWHGQMISVEADGSTEEGTPAVPPHSRRRYGFTPRPAGARWYHTHAAAGKSLQRGLYTGQFGFVYVEPASDPGRYDREVFLAMHQWEPFYAASMDEEDEDSAPAPPDNGLEVGYKAFAFNGKSLGHGEPVRVREGERVLFHFLNASATETVRVGLPAHQFEVIALDGNHVPNPQKVATLHIGVAERVDAVVTMNSPGVWTLGTLDDDDRKDGFGVVVEYAGRQGAPQWIKPAKPAWDYTVFGSEPGHVASPYGTFDLILKKIPGGHGGFNRWTINGKSWPDTDPLRVEAGRRYRMIFRNQSDDAHPLHLHRHSFELTKVYGKPTAGVLKDTVVVNANKTVEVDFTADNPGNTLFHCHQQLHMDFGFMALLKYT